MRSITARRMPCFIVFCFVVVIIAAKDTRRGLQPGNLTSESKESGPSEVEGAGRDLETLDCKIYSDCNAIEKSCSCDSLCDMYNDCCMNAPPRKERPTSLPDISPYMSCRRWRNVPIWVVTECPFESNETCSSEGQDFTSLSNVLVTDENNITYSNHRCAQCYGVSKYSYWTFLISHETLPNSPCNASTDIVCGDFENSTEICINTLLKKKCNVAAFPPKGTSVRHCIETEEITNDMSCRGEYLPILRKNVRKYYRNVDCCTKLEGECTGKEYTCWRMAQKSFESYSRTSAGYPMYTVFSFAKSNETYACSSEGQDFTSLSNVLVTDENNITYSNHRCAQCNGVSKNSYWTFLISHETLPNSPCNASTDIVCGDFENSTEICINTLLKKKCNVSAFPPKGTSVRHCIETEGCNDVSSCGEVEYHGLKFEFKVRFKYKTKTPDVNDSAPLVCLLTKYFGKTEDDLSVLDGRWEMWEASAAHPYALVVLNLRLESRSIFTRQRDIEDLKYNLRNMMLSVYVNDKDNVFALENIGEEDIEYNVSGLPEEVIRIGNKFINDWFGVLKNDVCESVQGLGFSDIPFHRCKHLNISVSNNGMNVEIVYKCLTFASPTTPGTITRGSTGGAAYLTLDRKISCLLLLTTSVGLFLL